VAAQRHEVRAPVLSVDPGRDKCGIAVLAADGRVLHQAVVAAATIAETVAKVISEHEVRTLILGDRTAAKKVEAALRGAGVSLKPVFVDEHRSSEQGRRRYFRDNRVRGWRRLVPVSLQTPPRPYDDYVAIVLAERYLADLKQD
jgi:RNase H-fold protein (predicted Holliday junction resolvase)